MNASHLTQKDSHFVKTENGFGDQKTNSQFVVQKSLKNIELFIATPAKRYCSGYGHLATTRMRVVIPFDNSELSHSTDLEANFLYRNLHIYYTHNEFCTAKENCAI